MKKNKHLWSLGIGLFSLFIFVPATLHITWAGQDESKKPESELTSKQIGAAHAELKKAEEVTRRTSDLTETVAPRLAATGSSNYQSPERISSMNTFSEPWSAMGFRMLLYPMTTSFVGVCTSM